MSYQNEQKKQIQRWLTSCLKKLKDIKEDVAGLEASDAEYKKVQVCIASSESVLCYNTIRGCYSTVNKDHDVFLKQPVIIVEFNTFVPYCEQTIDNLGGSSKQFQHS